MPTYLNPSETPPAEVISSSVQGDVQSVEVSSLPIEEFEEIYVDQESIDNRTKLETIKLGGGNGKVESKDGPAHHACPAVGPLLDIHATQARVKLYTSIKLIRQGGSLGSLRHLRIVVTW